jgi:hypothetical protein
MAYSLLIVCPDEFQAVCERYARFKRSRGISCLVHPFEAQRERDRLRGSPFLTKLKIDPKYLNERAACLKISLATYALATGTRYVLLAGDVDRIPVPWFEFVQDGYRYFYPTDLYYADLFSARSPREVAWDSWDPDADLIKGEFRADEISAIDFFPDLAVGRIPASSAAEIEIAFKRIVRSSAAAEAMRRRHVRLPRFVFLRGNDPTHPDITRWLEQVSAEASDKLTSRGYPVTRFSIEPNASADAAAKILAEVRQTLHQGGVEYLFWFGHGSQWGWPYFGPYSLTFSDEIPNITGAPVVFSMSCAVGFFTGGVRGTSYFSNGTLVSASATSNLPPAPVPDSLQPQPSGLEVDVAAEEWLVKHAAGATALIAGHSWGTLGSDYLRLQPFDFIDALVSMQREAPLGIIYNWMARRYVQRYKDRLKNDMAALNHLLRMHLFGDPSAPLFR